MLRYAISDGRSALGSIASPEAAFDPPNSACHSERSEEPPHFAPPPTPTHLHTHARSIAAQNIDFFLLREPTLSAGELAAHAREILPIFANTPTRLIIHSRPDIAIATRAHGVHLPSSHEALTPAQVRTLYAHANLPTPTISLSCHTEADLHRAVTLQPDLILFGPIFGKQIQSTPIHPGIGIDPLRAACRFAALIPILALGGVTAANTPACLEAGAAGIAAIRLFQP